MNDLKASIVQFFKDYIKYNWLDRDLESLKNIVSKNSTGFGTGLKEYAKPGATLLKVYSYAIKEVPSSIEPEFHFIDVDILNNTTAVINSMVDISTTIETQKVKVANVRMSLVVFKEKKNWKVRHLHVSTPSREHQDTESYPVAYAKDLNARLQLLLDEKTQELNETLKKENFLRISNERLFNQTSIKNVYNTIVSLIYEAIGKKGAITIAEFNLLWSNWQLMALKFSPEIKKIIGDKTLKEFKSLSGDLNFDFMNSIQPDTLTKPKNGKEYFIARNFSNKTVSDLEEPLRDYELYCFKSKLNDQSDFFLTITIHKDQYLDSVLISAVMRSAAQILEKIHGRINLSESESRYRAVVENSIHATAILKGNPISFTYVSPQFIKLTGYSENELLKMNQDEMAQLIHTDTRKKWLKNFSERLSGKNPKNTGTGKLIRKNGEILWVDAHSTTIVLSKEKVVQVSLVDLTEKIETRELLKNSEKKYREIVERAQDLIYQTDKNGNLTFVSPSIEKLSGYTIKEAIGMNLSKDGYFDPTHRDTFLKELNKKGYAQNFQAKMKKKDGSPYWVSTNARVLFDEEGNPNGVQGVSRDITELIKANEEVNSLQDRLKTIVEYSTNVFYRQELDNTLSYMSPQIKNMLGYTPNETKVNYKKLLSKNTFNDLGIKSAEKAMKTGVAQPPYELELVHKNGGLVWVEVNETPVIKDGKVQYIVGSLTDITTRKAADRELLKLKNRLSTIINNSTIVFFHQEVDKSFTFISPQIENLLGIGIDEALKNLNTFVSNNPINDIGREATKAALNTGIAQPPYEQELIHKDGHPVWIEVNEAPIVVDGKVTALVGSLTDITVRKKAEERMESANIKLLEAKELAERSDNIKSVFLANMSHEIRTPISSIMGFSDVLQMENMVKEEGKEYLNIIKSNSKQLLNLINDILDISKLESKQIKIKPEKIDVNKFAKEIMEQVVLSLKNSNKNIKFSNKMNNKKVDYLYTDKNRLYQVISNLFVNALKFTDSGKIEIGIKPYGDDKIRFHVRDTGIGIDNTHLTHIFTRFGQADHGLKYKSGSGLGLSIASGIVKLLGGEIWVESNVGSGSTFYFTVKKDLNTRVDENV